MSSHRFGTSAIVRVGREPAARDLMTGYRAAPQAFAPAARPQVRVGRDAQPQQQMQRTRVGAIDPATGQEMVGAPYQAPNCGVYDWTTACKRILGTGRQNVGAGLTVLFNVTPCGPFMVDCIIVPESFALLFEITSIKVCRDDFIQTPIPAEGFSDQSDYACNLACGATFFPSLPLILGVHNISSAAADFSAMVIGREIAFCG